MLGPQGEKRDDEEPPRGVIARYAPHMILMQLLGIIVCGCLFLFPPLSGHDPDHYSHNETREAIVAGGFAILMLVLIALLVRNLSELWHSFERRGGVAIWVYEGALVSAKWSHSLDEISALEQN